MPFPAHELTYKGRRQSIAAWSRETKIPVATIRSRLFKLKWSVERALATPPDRRFGRGGRKRSDAPRQCPALQEHADGRAFCRWSAGGKQRWRTFGTWGSDLARAAYRRFQLEWAAGQTEGNGAGACTVGRLVVRWIAHCEATYRKRGKPTSEVHCNRAAMKPLAELYGHEPAAEFTPPKLRAVREAMVEKRWVRKTVNDQVARILRAFSWAATELLVPPTLHAALAHVESIAAGRREDVGEGHGVDPVPAKHVEAVLRGTRLHPHAGRRVVLAAMVRVQLLTAMRPGELCSLKPEQIDRRKTPWRYEVTEYNKMLHRDLERPVFFGPLARGVLAPLLKAARRGQPVFLLPPVRKGASPSAVTPRRYRDYVQAACDLAKVPRWSPNQLRHNRATELMDRFEDDKAVGAVLGNSPEVARQVYAARAGEAVARRIAEATG